MYSPIYRHAALAPQSRVRAHTAAVQQDLHLERKPVPAPARHFACTAGPIICVCASCGTHRTGLNQHGSRGPYHTTIYTTHCLALAALYLAALGHTFAHGTHLLSRVVGGETLAHACKMGGGESKSDKLADAGDVRLEEARIALAADLERVEREGAVRLRQTKERLDSELERIEREAQAKQSDARSKKAGGEQARHRSAPGALVPVGLGATALATATALDSATPPFGFAPQQPSYTQAPSPRHLPGTAMHLLCSCHALTMH